MAEQGPCQKPGSDPYIAPPGRSRGCYAVLTLGSGHGLERPVELAAFGSVGLARGAASLGSLVLRLVLVHDARCSNGRAQKSGSEPDFGDVVPDDLARPRRADRARGHEAVEVRADGVDLENVADARRDGVRGGMLHHWRAKAAAAAAIRATLARIHIHCSLFIRVLSRGLGPPYTDTAGGRTYISLERRGFRFGAGWARSLASHQSMTCWSLARSAFCLSASAFRTVSA
jgi:hypothetical protein